MATLSVPSQVPPVAEDCEQLHKAFEGWGTDEAKIMDILAHRNARQRCLIRQTYAEMYGEDLLTALHKEISSNFERAVLLWILHPAERDALLANEAIKKGNVGHYILMEIACARTSRGLFEAREDYHARFKRSLEEDVAHHTDGDIRKLLVPLLTSHRYEGQEVDTTLAESEAEILHEKISESAYSHEEIIRIITTRSKAQLNATLKHYNESFGDAINKGLKSEKKDVFLALLRATITCLTNSDKYFERILRKSIMGLGTDEEALTRVVVTRAEVDLARIQEEYRRRNNVTLYSAIQGDTSGDYERMLLALVGKDSA